MSREKCPVFSAQKLAAAVTQAREEADEDWRQLVEMAGILDQHGAPQEDWVGDADPRLPWLDDEREEAALGGRPAWGFSDGAFDMDAGAAGPNSCLGSRTGSSA